MRLNYPEILPITGHRDEIVRAIAENQVVVVVGETGSGKSTQIPKMILEALAFERKLDPVQLAASKKSAAIKIACTQPRRIAAVSIATWMAKEMEVDLAKEVGYKIRFDDSSTEGTLINICTDGILLQEMKGDGLLSSYNAILVDEAHERNLNIDFLLGLLRDIQVKRVKAGLSRLKILVTSATVDANKFADFFADLNLDREGKKMPIPIINVSGRLYPVDLKYNSLGEKEDIFIKIADIVEEIYSEKGRGDVLIFMPGEAEINSVMQEIQILLRGKVQCVPLYSRLPMEEQEKVYQNFPGKMKVVVATNIAETSITVPGITHVIDSGLAKMTDFNFRTGIGSLETKTISQASATQRAGRAGRVAPGVCIRLYSEDDFRLREQYTKPEIQRSDLSSVVLHMLLIGIENLDTFHFIDMPSPRAFKNAINNLIELGAINDSLKLTDLGSRMAHLPLEPRISAMLLAAEKYGCVREVAVIASSLSVKDPFVRPIDQEDEADRAKKYFQKLAKGADSYNLIKVRKGRKIITRKVYEKNLMAGQSFASDLLVFLIVWNKWQAIFTDVERQAFCERNYLNHKVILEIEQIYRQLLDTLKNFARDEFAEYLIDENQHDLSVKIDNKIGVLKSICAGFLQNLCEQSGSQVYKTKSTDNVYIHPGSALFYEMPNYFVSAEIVETTRLYARNNTVMDPAWLEEIAPQMCTYQYGPIFYDRQSGKVLREETVFFRGRKIVRLRQSELADDDVKLAEQYFIREALMRGTLGREFKFIKNNIEVFKSAKTYLFKKNALKNTDFDDNALKQFYQNKFRQAGIGVTSKKILSGLLFDKGQHYLDLKIDDLIKAEDRQLLDAKYPNKIFVGGEWFHVDYFVDDLRYGNRVVINFSVQQLIDLDDANFSKEISKYSEISPLLVCSNGEPYQAIVGEGESVEELKKEVEHWHLKKSWKKIRRENEVNGIKIDEIWHYWGSVLNSVDIGISLFENGSASMVRGYVGLRKEGKKIIKTVFEEKEVAKKCAIDVLKAYLLYILKYNFYFKESEIDKLEELVGDSFEFDFASVLEKGLWAEIDLEKILSDEVAFTDVKFVKNYLNSIKDNIKPLKDNLFKKLCDKMLLIKALSSSNENSDLIKIANLKMDLENGDWIAC